MRPVITVYGREYCDLCKVMWAEVQQLGGDLGFTARWLDIDDDDELERRFGRLVPVLMAANDEMICHYHLDRRALDAYLARMR